jgi:hypothetical protein
LLHGSVFAVVLLSATTGWAETWTLARYPEYRFQAEFPGPVKEFPMTLNENPKNSSTAHIAIPIPRLQAMPASEFQRCMLCRQ